MFQLFIKRPILSCVISVLIVCLGILSLTNLPITQFPDIVPPSVTVTARYTGASADVMAKTVATPLERAINGVPGMTYMTTVCTNDGMSLTTIYFKVGTDPDVAAVNVQNRVTTVLDELPEEVIRAGVVTEKEVNSMLMYLNIFSTDTTHTEKFVYNFADINILRELKRIDGVGLVEIMGSRDYAMRVWLNPNRLAAYNMSPQDVTEAIRSQNIEAAPGKTGISSDKLPQHLQYVLQYTGKFSTPEEYGEIVLKAMSDGSLLRLKDVAKIEFDSEDYNMISMTDGRPSASIMIKQRPGSNAREVIQNIKAKMEEVKESSFVPGMDYNISYDVSRFLDASISAVLRTLLEAFLLVFIVVYIFLQDFRSTLIPAIAVPVSLIGTFFFMDAMGFSINMLTLFALVLSIGIVVDNAIVVVEAVHVKMHQLRLQPFEASVAAIKEIGSAIIAITLVMSAVFLPVGFMEGTVGIFYRQFSLTLAAAIFISGINALTLSPALCAMMLKPPGELHKKVGLMGRFFRLFNKHYQKFETGYASGLQRFLGRRFFTYATLIIFFLATWGMSSILPTGFIPNEDQSMIYVNVDTPPGATLERSEAALSSVQATLLPFEEVESISTLAGYSLMTETEGASFGMGMINLTPWSDRDKSADELMTVFADRTAHIKDAQIQFFLPPAVPGFGNASGFELRLQDRTAGSFEDLATVANELVERLNADPRLEGVSSGFNPNFPMYLLKVDLAKAAKLGVDLQESMETLQSYIGSFYSSNFIRFGQMYKVMLQASPEYRMDPDDVFSLFAKNKEGNMVPYSNFMTMERIYGPSQITRYNMFTSALITGDAAEGVSSGEAIAAVEEIAKDVLPRGYHTEWSGVTKEEKESGGQTIATFAICLLFVYLLLAAQYESLLLPFPVILSLPAGVFGSYLFLQIAGLENNIYAQVALVMLIGLLGKNAILIIEMANQYRQQGAGILEAALKGATSRLRPILMTSFAFICGLIPLVFATGAGALGNRSIGTAAAGGMFLGTMVGIFLIPGLYMLFEALETKLKTKKVKVNAPQIAAPAILLLASVSLWSCKAPELTSEEKMTLPETYIENQSETDTTTLALLSWEHFFPDTLLQSYIHTALQNNHSFQQTLEQVYLAQSQMKQRKQALFPQLSAGLSAGIQRFGEYTMDGVGNATTNTPDLERERHIPDPYKDLYFGVQFQWEADIWGKLSQKKRAAAARWMASAEAAQYARTLLISEVASRYFELIGLDKQQEILRGAIENTEFSYRLTYELKQEGEVTQLAVDQFQSRLLRLKGLLLETEQLTDETERALATLLGGFPFEVKRISFDEMRALEFPVQTGVPAQLLRYRPDIRAAEWELLASKADLQAARKAFFPSLIIGAGGGFNAFDLSHWFTAPASLVYNLAAGLSAPIFNQHELKLLWNEAKSNQRIALLQYHEAALKAYEEVVNLATAHEKLTLRCELKEEESETHHRSIENAKELFQLSFVGYLEVLSADERYLDCELERIELNTAKCINHVYLYRSLGGGIIR